MGRCATSDPRRRDLPAAARVPHSPQRMPDSIGLVIERRRLPDRAGRLLWFCERCNHKIYEEFFR
jgi:3-hydroxyanthranilate 3,4-dioxygenase